ncbi:MAG: hypothetical protein PHC28_13440 [Flavobacterium sp.]|uniref:hypothetical protein n=1 Tax=Flavobacterium sp. TaxID=239 RepID=UPI002603EC02|nr:hypothetical protein [Flavobacterium sp.]MDD5151456.1 hypothetical protein [Flavobacterium sp.]
MIHFDFILSDNDAENLFYLLHRNIIEKHLKIQKAIIDEDTALQKVYENDIIYIEELKSKLINKRIENNVTTNI